jgi:hypothetical protein
VLPEGLGKLKKFIHLIGCRTRNIPACSIVPECYIQRRRSVYWDRFLGSKNDREVSRLSKQGSLCVESLPLRAVTAYTETRLYNQPIQNTGIRSDWQ